MSAASSFPLVGRAAAFGDRTAIRDAAGTSTYHALVRRSAHLAARLLDGRRDLAGARVLLLAAPGADFVAALWAIWRAGGMAVPLSPHQPPAEWTDVCEDARPEAAIVEHGYAQAFAPVAVGQSVRRIPLASGAPLARELPAVDADRPALMLYTSGTTSRPKGVVITHGNVQAQVECLVDAWAWRETDRIPLVLPLNHVHGLINVVTCALWSGAVCEVLPGSFDAAAVWERLAGGDVTVFMAVPTIYHRLIAAWESAAPDTRAVWAEGAAGLRLMVSGSSALPVGVLERWRQITGHVLLERYGMTEIGMALSNPLAGERRPGFVGVPLPGVEVALLDERGRDVAEGTPGELHVRGATVFREYWSRAAATAEAFREGRWFRTGDAAVVVDGMYRILGRLSVDIIKTGGEKVSALEIEEALRQHPAITDCAVVGVPDAEWGESVGAAVVAAGGTPIELAALRDWARNRLSAAKLPRRLLLVDQLPRNAMGKVSKPRVIDLFQAS